MLNSRKLLERISLVLEFNAKFFCSRSLRTTSPDASHLAAPSQQNVRGRVFVLPPAHPGPPRRGSATPSQLCHLPDAAARQPAPTHSEDPDGRAVDLCQRVLSGPAFSGHSQFRSASWSGSRRSWASARGHVHAAVSARISSVSKILKLVKIIHDNFGNFFSYLVRYLKNISLFCFKDMGFIHDSKLA